MIEKQACRDPATVLVTFRISHAVWADRFALVGDFDGQHQEALPMVQSALDPDWHITITLDLGQRYRFYYLCDEQDWNSDGGADGSIIGGDGRVYGIVDTSTGCYYRMRLRDTENSDPSGPEYIRSAL